MWASNLYALCSKAKATKVRHNVYAGIKVWITEKARALSSGSRKGGYAAAGKLSNISSRPSRAPAHAAACTELARNYIRLRAPL